MAPRCGQSLTSLAAIHSPALRPERSRDSCLTEDKLFGSVVEMDGRYKISGIVIE